MNVKGNEIMSSMNEMSNMAEHIGDRLVIKTYQPWPRIQTISATSATSTPSTIFTKSPISTIPVVIMYNSDEQ